MTIKAMIRVFEYAGVRFPDPNVKMTVEQVRGVLATQYPKIATAALTGPEKVGDKCVYRSARATIQQLVTANATTTYLLDLGNGYVGGQFILSQPLNRRNPRRKTRLRTLPRNRRRHNP